MAPDAGIQRNVYTEFPLLKVTGLGLQRLWSTKYSAVLTKDAALSWQLTQAKRFTHWHSSDGLLQRSKCIRPGITVWLSPLMGFISLINYTQYSFFPNISSQQITPCELSVTYPHLYPLKWISWQNLEASPQLIHLAWRCFPSYDLR